MLCCAENLDATVMSILSPKKQLKGTKLKASRLTPVLSVLVTKISNEACKEDKLKLYFKNKKKSGGGKLQGVEVKAKGEAIVTFQEPEGTVCVCVWEYLRNFIQLFQFNAKFLYLTLTKQLLNSIMLCCANLANNPS